MMLEDGLETLLALFRHGTQFTDTFFAEDSTTLENSRSLLAHGIPVVMNKLRIISIVIGYG